MFVTFEQRLAPFLLLLSIVLGLGLLPVALLYWPGQSAKVPGGSSGSDAKRTPWQRLEVPPVRAVVFKNVNVVPMDAEHVLAARDVLVEGGRVVAIRPTAARSDRDDVTVVNASGKFLLPGLVDMHVHLPSSDAEQEAVLELFAANGVTAVLNLWGAPAHVRLRERIRHGQLLGPTVYTSGPYISNAPFHSPTATEAAAAVKDQKAAGYDVIKIHGDFSRGAYRTVIRAARRAGMKVVGHAPRNIGLEPIFEERQDALAHVEEYIYAYYRFGQSSNAVPPDVEALTRSVATRTREAGVQVIANLTAYHGIWKQAADVRPLLARPEVALVPARIRDEWQPDRNTYVRRFGGSPRPFEEWYRVLQALVAELDRAGVPLMAGSDTPIPCVVPGFSLHDELQDLVAAGLTPYRALRAATVTPASFLSQARTFGTLAVGRRADLLLVDKNPLADIRALARPAGVMLQGRWLDRQTLDARLAAVANYTR